MNHTAIPWKVRTLPEQYGGGCFIEAPEVVAGQSVAGDYHREIMGDDCDPEQKQADAEFIVRACNNYEAVLEALMIFARPDRHLEHTPGGYYIFRLPEKDTQQVMAALTAAVEAHEAYRKGADHA